MTTMTDTTAPTTYGYAETPIGRLLLVSGPAGLRSVSIDGHRLAPSPAADWRHDETVVDDARRQLDEYFGGTRQYFDLPLDPLGTAFQRGVWDALRHVPFGATRSYRDIAERIGRPTAARAVGAANGRNPLCIVVPCHRIVGAAGDLTGYAYGVERKQWLLAHEAEVSRGTQ